MQVTSRWLRTSNLLRSAQADMVGLADLKNYNAAYAEWGDGPPIILIPGLAGGIDLVRPLARCLAEQFHVIALELRGEGDSFALRTRFGLADLADDLEEFVAWRGIERPALVGVSFGGVVSLMAAARHPGLFAAVGVQGVGYRFEFGLLQRIASMVLANYPLPDNCPFVNQFFGLLFGHRPHDEQLRYAAQSCWQTDQGVMTHRLQLLRRSNLTQLLPQVKAPTLLVSGARDQIVSQANAQALVDRIPDCHQAVLPKAGHLAPVSHAAAVSSAIADFLAAAV